MKRLALLALMIFSCQYEPLGNVEKITIEQEPIEVIEIDDSTVLNRFADGSLEISIVDEFSEKNDLKTSVSRVVVDATASPSTVVGTAEQLVTITGSGFGNVKGRVYYGSYFVYGGQILEWTDTKVAAQIPITNTGNYSVTLRTNDGATVIATANSIYAEWGVYKASGSDGLGSYRLYNGNYINGNGQGFRTYHCKTGTPESFKNTIRDVFQYIYDETGLLMILGEDVDGVISDLNDGIWMLGLEAGSGVGRATVKFTNCGDNTFYASDGYASWDGSQGFSVTAHEIIHTLGQGHGSGLMCSSTSCITSSLSDATREGIAYNINVSVNQPTSCQPVLEVSNVPLFTYYEDNDGDGYGSNVSVQAETQPDGYVTNSGDCDDGDPSINPSATEILDNNIDEDCDGTAQQTPVLTWYLDVDADGFGNPSVYIMSTKQPPSDFYEYILTGGDCNDNNPNINPDAYDIPRNGIDENCDGRDTKGRGKKN